MKEIHLTQGLVALIDDEDFDFVNQWKWCVARTETSIYAKRTNKGILMHREILILHNPGVYIPCVDHINHNGLDNQKHNIRIASAHQNVGNSRKQDNTTSVYKGVHFETWSKRWRASIRNSDGKIVKSPRYNDEKLAALWYNERALDYFGEFALVNEL